MLSGNSKVLVTGAAGHLGGNLVRALLDRGREVRVLDKDLRAVEGLEVERIEGDIRDRDGMQAACRGVETVFHLAAVISITGSQGGLVNAINVDGTSAVARAALAGQVKRMVHVSSIHAFQQQPLSEPLDETRDRVGREGKAYDRSKAGGEAVVREAIAEGLDAVITQPTAVIGPYDFRPSRMGRVFLDLYHRRLPALIEGGFDWVDARDVVEGLLAAEAHGRSGESYLLSGHWHSVRELAAMAAEYTGVKAPTLTCPQWLARPLAPFAVLAARALSREPLFTGESLAALRANRNICSDKAARELGYTVRPTAETVLAVYDWFEQAGWLASG